MPKTVLLDLDGTLSNSGLAIIKSINYALINLGHKELEGDTSWVVGPHFGQPLESLNRGE